MLSRDDLSSSEQKFGGNMNKEDHSHVDSDGNGEQCTGIWRKDHFVQKQ
jgi:hypothetical protein